LELNPDGVCVRIENDTNITNAGSGRQQFEGKFVPLLDEVLSAQKHLPGAIEALQRRAPCTVHRATCNVREGSCLAVAFAASIGVQPDAIKGRIRVMPMAGGLKALDAIGTVTAL
jgi:hypothetical protein